MKMERDLSNLHGHFHKRTQNLGHGMVSLLSFVIGNWSDCGGVFFVLFCFFLVLLFFI